MPFWGGGGYIDLSALGPTNGELREDNSFELREDNAFELRE